MSKPEWIDATSYSRGQERTPTAWRIEAGSGFQKISVYVTRAHRWLPGKWAMVCQAAHISADNPYELGSVSEISENDAKDKALRIAVSRIRRIADSAEALLQKGESE